VGFVGDTQWIQFGDDKSNRTAIGAVRTSPEGNNRFKTNPPGSVWTKNPIPACAGYLGGAAGAPCDKAQFEPVLQDSIPAHPKYAKSKGLYGFGPGAAHASSDEVKNSLIFSTIYFLSLTANHHIHPGSLLDGTLQFQHC
jgi:hypothetical protein